MTHGSVFAISDLHISVRDNRPLIDQLKPESPDDWLIVAGDVGEVFREIELTLRQLNDRFQKVIWVPGNHELWTMKSDPVELRGAHRYEALVDMCRNLGVVTPEDTYPVWSGADGDITIAPLFAHYDYSFRRDQTLSIKQSLDQAYEAGVVCTDEFLLHNDPYDGAAAWCEQRVEYTEARLSALDPATSTLLVNHFPLVKEPTDVLYYPEFAQWCGTLRTADWHRRYRAVKVVYGHLHISRLTTYDDVPFHEVSVGYPREWKRRGLPDPLLRPVLPL